MIESPPWIVAEVRDLGAQRLFVRFVDGTQGEVDVSRLIRRAGVFEPLRDEREFARVYVDDGAVTWPGEIDLAPDAMYRAIRTQGHWVPD